MDTAAAPQVRTDEEGAGLVLCDVDDLAGADFHADLRDRLAEGEDLPVRAEALALAEAVRRSGRPALAVHRLTVRATVLAIR